MSSIQIHGFAPSTYTRSALLAAEAVGVVAELVPLAFGEESHLALHPFTKMPVLTDGDQRVFETLAIMAYLDTEYGSRQLFPEESFASILEVCSAAIDYGYRSLVHPGDDATARAATERTLHWIESCLGRHACLATEEISAADLLVAPMLEYYRRTTLDGGTFSEWPQIEAWLAALRERPGFRTLISEAA